MELKNVGTVIPCRQQLVMQVDYEREECCEVWPVVGYLVLPPKEGQPAWKVRMHPLVQPDLDFDMNTDDGDSIAPEAITVAEALEKNFPDYKKVWIRPRRPTERSLSWQQP